MSKSKLLHFGKCGLWYMAIGRFFALSRDYFAILVWCEIVVDTCLNAPEGR